MKRIANVWTPDGAFDHPVDGEWPPSIICGRWIVRHDVARDGSPLVHRGRHSGAEFLRYASCSEATCADVPELIAALGLEEEYIRGDGRQPDADRRTRAHERREPATAARDERRRFFRRGPRGAEVQGR